MTTLLVSLLLYLGATFTTIDNNDSNTTSLPTTEEPSHNLIVEDDVNGGQVNNTMVFNFLLFFQSLSLSFNLLKTIVLIRKVIE